MGLVDFLFGGSEAAVDKDTDKAVLIELVRRLPNVTENTVWLGSTNEKQIEDCQKQVTEVRAWAATLPPGAARRAYFKWLDVWQRGIYGARQELATHAIRKRYEEVGRKMKEEDRRAAAVGIPVPPRS